MISRIFLFSILICLGLNLRAQDEAVVFRAVLINPNTKEAVPFANIFISNKQQGSSSNSEGKFNLLLNYSDTLKISAIGYVPFTYILRDTVNLENVVKLDMHPMIYELAEVRITPYLTYADLRRAFVNFKPTEEEIKYKRFMQNLMNVMSISEYVPPAKTQGIAIRGPFSLMYNAFSKHAKSQRKLRRFMKEDNIEAVISSKYTVEIVSRLTGEKDKEVVKDFMAFCNLPEEYLIEVSDINLYQNLLIRYDVFLENIASK